MFKHSSIFNCETISEYFRFFLGVLESYKLMPAYKKMIFFSNAMFRSCDFPKHSLSFLVPYSSFLNYTQVLSFSEYILLLLLNHFLPFRHNQVLHKQLASLSVRSRKKLIRFCDLHIMDLIFYEQQKQGIYVEFMQKEFQS